MFRTLDDLDAAGKRVLVRVDLNVPITDGAVSDASRITRVAPTLIELADQGARVVALSHLGRPKGQRIEALSVAPLVDHLSGALGGRPVAFADDCIGAAAETAVAGLGDGDVALLENLRFHAGEEANDPEFAAALARLGDVYVDDAFSAAHRAHASNVGVAGLLPAYAGRLMQEELAALDAALEHPKRPVAAVVGGAKVSTKLAILGHLVERVDMLIIGGAMANTFLHALGVSVGRSLCEPDMADTARDIVARAKRAGCDVVLPTDAVTATRFEAGAPRTTCSIKEVADDAMILDLGPATAAHLARRLGEVATVVWNGPLGAFELEGFDAATNTVAREVARLTQDGRVVSVAGGGDTVAALGHAGVGDAFSYVSTAGGAFLEWLEGKELPGVAALGAEASCAGRPMNRRFIVFHNLEHAHAALNAAVEADIPVTLRSAPGAAAYAGAGYLKAITDAAAKERPGAQATWVIDCGADAGTALGALRIGWKRVCFSGPESLRNKLSDIAAQQDAAVTDEAHDETILDLLDRHDPLAACREFMAATVE